MKFYETLRNVKSMISWVPTGTNSRVPMLVVLIFHNLAEDVKEKADPILAAIWTTCLAILTAAFPISSMLSLEDLAVHQKVFVNRHNRQKEKTYAANLP